MFLVPRKFGSLSLRLPSIPFCVVRSRSLLTYEGSHPLEEQHLSDHSNTLDKHLDASKHSVPSLESMSRAQHDEVTEITIANETRLEKPVLVGLQPHR